MAYIKAFGHSLSALRNLVWPDYQPERHYMRGPGPACARRHQQG